MSHTNDCMSMKMSISKLFYVMTFILSIMCQSAKPVKSVTKAPAKTVEKPSAKTRSRPKPTPEEIKKFKCPYAIDNGILDSETEIEIRCMPEKWWKFNVNDTEPILLDEIMERKDIASYYDSYVEMSYIAKDLSSDFLMLINALKVAEAQLPTELKSIIMPFVKFFGKYNQQDYYFFIDLINCLVFTAFHTPDGIQYAQKEIEIQHNSKVVA
ncbi:hypothetical protein CWI40_010790 [Ordospora colligata]|nr:hypothetical protein CWI40_010790 [Ordospora colligata]